MLLYTDETDRIEAKEASQGLGKSFLETVSALSNEPGLGGGYIILGASKNKANISPRYIVKGIADPDNMQQQIASQCRDSFSIAIRPIIKVISHAQGSLILVHIPEAETHEKPVFIKNKGMENGAYRRIGSTDQLCTREDFDRLYQYRTKHKYEASLVEEASFADFDNDAIQTYRKIRKEIKADASELELNDQDLMLALKAIATENGATHPTVAGMLLFGKHMSLRRMFPQQNHIDYLLVEGIQWMSNPERRFTAVEMNEPLITGIPYLLGKIMNSIPQIFAMHPNGYQRKDNPLIPRAVIREALVNAVMHKDYLTSSPIQVIEYANRIEFRNVGYSLKPNDQIGLPGSMARNDIMANVFRDINYAEFKGTGIGKMRDDMRKANLSVPLIESSRQNNLFVLSLLSHHLFTKQNIEWLGHFKSLNLTDEEARTLIVLRDKGVITNADYRDIHCVDTLTASAHLRKLRDNDLIEQMGSGSATYYTPTLRLLTADSNISIEGVTFNNNTADSKLPKELEEEIQSIGKKTQAHTVKQTIKKLCSIRPYKASELAILLKRNLRHVRNRYLAPMTASGDLELTFPNNPVHPLQTYKTRNLNLD